VHPLDQLRGAQADACNDIAVATNILGGGIEDKVRSMSKRVLPKGTQKGIVHHQDRATIWSTVTLGQLGARADIHQFVGRICGGLHIDHPELISDVCFLYYLRYLAQLAAKNDVSRFRNSRRVVLMAAIPLSKTEQASASSHKVRRSSKISRSGLFNRL